MRLQHLPFTIGDAHDVVASIVRIVDLTGVGIDDLRQIAIDVAECRDGSDSILGTRSQVWILGIAVGGMVSRRNFLSDIEQDASGEATPGTGRRPGLWVSVSSRLIWLWLGGCVGR